MRRLAIAVVLLGAAACSSKKDPSACPGTDGSYVLTVSPTGQSENNQAICSQQTSGATEVDVQVSGSSASVGGGDCVVTSTAGCEIEVACAPVDAGEVSQSTVRYVAFALPTSSSPQTENALVELGPAYCAFEGTAVVASETPSSGSDQ
jgi:hypothetical protein